MSGLLVIDLDKPVSAENGVSGKYGGESVTNGRVFEGVFKERRECQHVGHGKVYDQHDDAKQVTYAASFGLGNFFLLVAVEFFVHFPMFRFWVKFSLMKGASFF